ncbi:Holliday junction branch migration protein RuvA [Hathewaya histolytica]|uniref:Holliday junction branch migration complex subunit RuvA n=2 Tax=Hathewaya histolytica TaxID=1498 RepID=RUVA_HATHI|nr:Holliday junction branch migration protein RuvA [Hathewaya histolytica]Q9ZNJ6.1 RecName: Full=Holliday junction branch migration complex subunit RuvA [Hathewaya histolytica]BAA34545.1 ruvA [Hathewaya histolytica]VTQ92533.1 Holliday junction DNA helicase RuvA [Hathewaya histolytica]
MYEYIKGTYMGINKEYIVIENGDIGYKIHSSGYTIANMPNIGEHIMLYLTQIVREDFIGLYGFGSKEELELFNKLLTVNGIGAKASLSLLSITNVENLKRAIVLEDEKLLIKAPGIGKKTAQRIILELKDKLDVNLDEGIQTDSNDIKVSSKILEEAKEALMSLGYSEKECEKALKNVEEKESLEIIIKESLKFLMN